MSNYSEMLKGAQPKIVITPASLIMEKVGDTFRGLYLGQKETTKTDPKTGEVKILQVANFYDGEKVLFNMGAQLTRAIAPLRTGVSVEIKLIELKSNNKGGKTKIYSVAPLDVPIQDVAELFGGFLEVTAPKPEDLMFSEPAPAAQLPAQTKTTGDILRDIGFEPEKPAAPAAQPVLMGQAKKFDFIPD